MNSRPKKHKGQLIFNKFLLCQNIFLFLATLFEKASYFKKGYKLDTLGSDFIKQKWAVFKLLRNTVEDQYFSNEGPWKISDE